MNPQIVAPTSLPRAASAGSPGQTVLVALLLTAVVTTALLLLTKSLRTHSPYVAHPSVFVPFVAEF